MTGTSTSATIAGMACAAASLFTVTRTSSLPAACRARTCAAVAATSAVSVFVIDWTTIGWALPTCTPPTLTVTVGRRVLTGGKYSARALWRGRELQVLLLLEDLVLDNDPDRHGSENHLALQPGHRESIWIRSAGD